MGLTCGGCGSVGMLQPAWGTQEIAHLRLTGFSGYCPSSQGVRELGDHLRISQGRREYVGIISLFFLSFK